MAARLWRYECAAGHVYEVYWMHAACPKCDGEWASVKAVL